MSQKKLYKKSTNTLTVTLTDSAGVLVTGATSVIGTLVDGTSAPVTNATNIAFTEVNPTTKPGVYTGTLTSAFDPPVATTYTLQVTAVQGGRQLYGESSVSVLVFVIK